MVKGIETLHLVDEIKMHGQLMATSRGRSVLVYGINLLKLLKAVNTYIQVGLNKQQIFLSVWQVKDDNLAISITYIHALAMQFRFITTVKRER